MQHSNDSIHTENVSVSNEKDSLFVQERLRIPLQSGQLIIGAFQFLDETVSEFSHSHNEYEIYYCLSSSMSIKIRESVINLQTGDYVCISPTVPHCIISTPNIKRKALMILFDPSKLRLDLDNSETAFLRAVKELFKDGNDWLMIKDHRHCDELIRLIANDYNEAHYAWEYTVGIKICWLLVELFRNRLPLPNTSGRDAHSMAENIATQIDQYIHRNYMYDITIDDAASTFYMTPRNINRILQQYLGISFQKMLMMERLNRAKTFLINTDYSIDTIAEMVGLNSVGSLFRLFRENEGLSPSAYRNMYKT